MTGRIDNDAKAVSEALLEKSGISLANGDFDTFAECFLLPQDMETFEGRRRIETRDELRAIFEAVRQFKKRSGVTQMIRHCIAAAFRDADTVEATHISRMLAGDRLVQGPYPAFSVICRVEGEWRVTSSQYAVDEPGLNEALHAGTELS